MNSGSVPNHDGKVDEAEAAQRELWRLEPKAHSHWDARMLEVLDIIHGFVSQEWRVW